MPSGRLGVADLAAITNTTVYTCAATSFGVVNVNVCNRNTTAVTVRLAVAAAATPVNSEWIEFDTIIPANSVLERTGIAISPTQRIVAYASAANVSVVVGGVET